MQTDEILPNKPKLTKKNRLCQPQYFPSRFCTRRETDFCFKVGVARLVKTDPIVQVGFTRFVKTDPIFQVGSPRFVKNRPDPIFFFNSDVQCLLKLS